MAKSLIDNVTSRHKGQRFIIGGTAPNIAYLDPAILKTGVVIGVNRFPHFYKPDYWLTCDPQNIKNRMDGVLSKLGGVETFIHEHFSVKPPACYRFKRPPSTVLDNFRQPVGEYGIPFTWSGHLQHVWTSATAAANLAKIMGASEIVLFAVDILGPTRRGEEMVEWACMADDISAFFKKLGIPVYKTNPDSPLDLPLLGAMEVLNDDDLRSPDPGELPAVGSDSGPDAEESGGVVEIAHEPGPCGLLDTNLFGP